MRSEPSLSDLDARIIECIAAGERTINIATKLYLSRQGVEYHVSKLLQYLRVPNRPALIAKAYCMGILTTDTWPPEVRSREREFERGEMTARTGPAIPDQTGQSMREQPRPRLPVTTLVDHPRCQVHPR